MTRRSGSGRFGLALVAIQTLTTGIAIPLLSAYSIHVWPPRLSVRWRLLEAADTTLGFPWGPGALSPAVRQTRGLEDLVGIGVSLAGIVLLVGCATLAMLVFLRAWARRPDHMVHAALGATRSDLRRHIMGDLTRLLVVGGVLGTSVGSALVAWLHAVAGPALVPPAQPFSELALVAIAAPVLAVVGAASSEAMGAIRRFRAPITVAPVARLLRLGAGAAYFGAILATLTVAALLLKSTGEPETETDGWSRARDTLAIEVQAETAAEIAGALETLPWQLSSPGAFESLGVTEPVLVMCGCSFGGMPAPVVTVPLQHHAVSPGTFASVGIPLLQGREFGQEDGPGAPPVVIIDRTLASLMVGVDPIGKAIRIGPVRGAGTWYEIIGVADVPPLDHLGTRSRRLGSLYLSTLQHPPRRAQLLAPGRASDRDAALAELAAAAPRLTVGSAMTLERRRSMWTRPARGLGWVLAILAVVAFLIGVPGLVVSIALEIRNRGSELGVRRALGARRRDVRRVVLRDVGRVVVWGGAIGLPVAAGLARGLDDRFAMVQMLDVPLAARVLAVLAVAALTTAIGAIHRANRVMPIEAIRSI